MAKKQNETSIIGAAAVLAVAAIVAYALPEPRLVNEGNEPRNGEPKANLHELADGRGRDAKSPTELPAKGWKDVVWRTYEQVGEDRLLAVAAGVVFYGLLALFPAITALVSSYALFADASTINDHLSALSGILPAGSFSIVQDLAAYCRKAMSRLERHSPSASFWRSGVLTAG